MSYKKGYFLYLHKVKNKNIYIKEILRYITYLNYEKKRLIWKIIIKIGNKIHDENQLKLKSI